MKEEFKLLISEFEKFKLPDIIKRDIAIPRHNLISIVGPRRSGKTYLLYQKIKEFDKKGCLFVNFERGNLLGCSAKNFKDMIDAYKELFGKEPRFLFLDEIQAVKDWALGIRELYEKGYNIFLTGSSSKLLSREIATQLRGRCISVFVLPFSFKEFLRAKNIDVSEFSMYTERGILFKLLNEYIEKGGYPEPTLKPEIYEDLLLSIKDGVFYKDIVERFKVKKVKTFEFLTKILVSNFSSYYTYSKLQNIMSSSGIKISKNTVVEFVKMLEDIFLIYSVDRFESKVKETIKTPKKVYVVDNSLIKFFSPRFSRDVGRLMENTVFLELKRREKSSEIYYVDNSKGEVDFFVKSLHGKKLLQVTYASGKDEISSREVKSLLAASDQLKCKDMLIITWDYEDEIKLGNKAIK
ncbi:MAG: ATP-binding protein, partial [Candidatus Aenigmarchaeota archaeon]|nr:ATP-binding protein [Candidatus Aenigmarchaeota archaeon]